MTYVRLSRTLSSVWSLTAYPKGGLRVTADCRSDRRSEPGADLGYERLVARLWPDLRPARQRRASYGRGSQRRQPECLRRQSGRHRRSRWQRGTARRFGLLEKHRPDAHLPRLTTMGRQRLLGHVVNRISRSTEFCSASLHRICKLCVRQKRKARMDWPQKGARGAKRIRRVSSRKIHRFALAVVFAPLALFCGYPALPLLGFRADRFGVVQI